MFGTICLKTKRIAAEKKKKKKKRKMRTKEKDPRLTVLQLARGGQDLWLKKKKKKSFCG
jgi:hypothetical protein